MLKLADEWNAIARALRVQFLNGDRQRYGVLTPQEESLYLDAAGPLLHDGTGLGLNLGYLDKS